MFNLLKCNVSTFATFFMILGPEIFFLHLPQSPFLWVFSSPLYNPSNLSLLNFKRWRFCPGWCGSGDCASSRKLKSHRFVLRLGHVPSLWVWSQSQRLRKASPPIHVSLPATPLSLPLCLKSISMSSGEDKNDSNRNKQTANVLLVYSNTFFPLLFIFPCSPLLPSAIACLWYLT